MFEIWAPCSTDAWPGSMWSWGPLEKFWRSTSVPPVTGCSDGTGVAATEPGGVAGTLGRGALQAAVTWEAPAALPPGAPLSPPRLHAVASSVRVRATTVAASALPGRVIVAPSPLGPGRPTSGQALVVNVKGFLPKLFAGT